MKLPIVDENSIPALDLPGRQLRWLMTQENVDARHCSMCMIQVAPGETVRPAHSHPNGEEIIYIVRGSGKVMIEGVVEPVKAGARFYFPGENTYAAEYGNRGDEGCLFLCARDQP